MNTKKFTVMFYGVGKDPEVQEWPDGDLETMQICVNGFIDSIPHPLKDLVIVINEEGKLNEDPPNRHLYREGKIIDTIVGDFFVCRQHRDDLVSLTDADIRLLYLEHNSPDLIKRLEGLAAI